MAAIGSVWASGSWADDVWAAGSWAGAVESTTPVASPTRLVFDYSPFTLTFLTPEAAAMAVPLIFTAGETGDLEMQCLGANGVAQDLTGATVTFTLQNLNGTVYADAVSLTITTATSGIVTWDRLSAQVGTPGDYIAQTKAVLADGTPVFFPSSRSSVEGFSGTPVTILRAVGS